MMTFWQFPHSLPLAWQQPQQFHRIDGIDATVAVDVGGKGRQGGGVFGQVGDQAVHVGVIDHPVAVQAQATDGETATAAGRPSINEEWVTFDGGKVLLETTKSPMFGRDGQLIGVLGIGHDITERKRAEDMLRQSERKLRAVLDATPFPVALVDLQDNHIHFWSQSAIHFFGHTPPTAEEWYQVAYPDAAYRREVISRWKTYLEQARQKGQAVNTGEYRVTCRDGSALD